MRDARLYERAGSGGASLRPLWHVGEHVSVFAGALRHNAGHRHSVPVLLSGLYGTFRLRVGNPEWVVCEAAVIPAGIEYEFDMRGDVLAVIYLEPTAGAAETLTPLLRDRREHGGAFVGRNASGRALRDVYEDAGSAAWAGDAMMDLLGVTAGGLRREMDPRIALAVDALRCRPGDVTPVAALAKAAGLSASRFQHLFAAEIGVPYRRYRAWERMRAAIREVLRGANLTGAAHAAGFTDQAHFAHDFKRMFGAPATPSLINVRS